MNPNNMQMLNLCPLKDTQDTLFVSCTSDLSYINYQHHKIAGLFILRANRDISFSFFDLTKSYNHSSIQFTNTLEKIFSLEGAPARVPLK